MWINLEIDLPPVNIEVLGWSPEWVDEDYNRSGVRTCFMGDDFLWTSSEWDNVQDEYVTNYHSLPHCWQLKPAPPYNQ